MRSISTPKSTQRCCDSCCTVFLNRTPNLGTPIYIQYFCSHIVNVKALYTDVCLIVVCLHVCMYVCVYVCMHELYMHVCMHVCMECLASGCQRSCQGAPSPKLSPRLSRRPSWSYRSSFSSPGHLSVSFEILIGCLLDAWCGAVDCFALHGKLTANPGAHQITKRAGCPNCSHEL